MKSAAIISVGILVAGLLAAAAAVRIAPQVPAADGPQESCPDFQQSQLQLGEYPITVGIAAAPAEQRRGLSGCKQLPAGSGLLFSYQPEQVVTFWMKDMLIPIDIIWITDGRVVGIEHDVPPPAPGTPDEELVRYTPPEPVSAVLEVAAGTAAGQGIAPGTPIQTGL